MRRSQSPHPPQSTSQHKGPLLCRRYGFVMMVYSSQLVIMYWAWSFHGCAWSMSLQWRKSPESAGLLALRTTSFLGVASGYTSSILVLKEVTRAGKIRVLQRLLAVIRLPTCALYITQYRYTLCRDMIRWYKKHEDQPCCCKTNCCCCIHCSDCKTRDHGTLYTLDNRFQVNRQSIGSYSNRRPVVACDMLSVGSFWSLWLAIDFDWHHWSILRPILYWHVIPKPIIETDSYR